MFQEYFVAKSLQFAVTISVYQFRLDVAFRHGKRDFIISVDYSGQMIPPIGLDHFCHIMCVSPLQGLIKDRVYLSAPDYPKVFILDIIPFLMPIVLGEIFQSEALSDLPTQKVSKFFVLDDQLFGPDIFLRCKLLKVLVVVLGNLAVGRLMVIGTVEQSQTQRFSSPVPNFPFHLPVTG